MRGLWNQNPFKNVEDVSEEWTVAELQEPPHTDISRTSQDLEEEWRSTSSELCERKCSYHSQCGRQFPHSLMVWGAMASAGVGGLFRSKFNAAENLWLKIKMQDNRPNNAKELKAVIRATIGPLVTQNL